jgi:hypothetical protein
LREAESNGIGSNRRYHGLTPISMLLIIRDLCKNVDKPKISSFYSAFSARYKRSKKRRTQEKH